MTNEATKACTRPQREQRTDAGFIFFGRADLPAAEESKQRSLRKGHRGMATKREVLEGELEALREGVLQLSVRLHNTSLGACNRWASPKESLVVGSARAAPPRACYCTAVSLGLACDCSCAPVALPGRGSASGGWGGAPPPAIHGAEQ